MKAVAAAAADSSGFDSQLLLRSTITAIAIAIIALDASPLLHSIASAVESRSLGVQCARAR